MTEQTIESGVTMDCTAYIPRAIAAYNANRIYCKMIGDPVPPAWADAPLATRNGCIGAVYRLEQTQAPLSRPDLSEDAIDGIVASLANQHANWMQTRLAAGWVYGPVKSDVDKTHPNIAPYNTLPVEQKVKDLIFHAVSLA